MIANPTKDIYQNSLKIYEYFLSSYYTNGNLVPGKNISNPFLARKQKTPSFNIYKGRDGGYLFYDYATGDKGAVITFVMRIKNTTYQNAVKIINQIIV